MTYRSASSNWAAFCKPLGISGVLAASLAVGVASGQQERTTRASDRSSDQDESTRSRDESERLERARSSSNQSDQQRRRSSDQSFERDQDRASPNRSQQGTQFGARAQEQSGQNQYGQTRQDQYGQQGRISQGQSQQSRYQAEDRSATNSRSRDEQYGAQRTSQESDSAWLGVYLRESQTNENGAQVTQVYPAGPAARAGLRAGDVITAVDGERVSNGEELINAIEQQQPGARAQLSLLRNNQQIELPITLGSRQSFAWHRPGEDSWGGHHGGQGGYATSSRSGSEEFRSGQSGDDDYWSNVPPFAMQLEHERRMYEQHQRIETQIAKLQDEIRQLREELRQRR